MIHKSYHEGRVQSLWFDTADGKASIGVVSAGTYEFTTDCTEHVIVINGSLELVLADGCSRWIGPNGSYDVPARTQFTVRATGDVAYLCQFRP